MFKRIFFIVLIISQWSLVRSQTISRQVVSNGGGTLSGGGNQITFNIGETVIPSFGSGAILMTQGFEQPGEHITTGVVTLVNCAGSSFTVPFTSVDILAGNTYTAQLSNDVGSFASPVNIGTLLGNGSSGSVNITIPLNTPPGNGYRIRVVGSMPQTTGTANSNGAITINPATFNATNTGPYVTNQTIQLVGSGGSTYSWVGPNGFTATGAIVNRPNAVLSMAGIYTVTASNGLCSNTATTNVAVTGIDPCVQIMEYTYVKSGNPYQTLYSLQNGMVINQEVFPTSILVRPICPSVVVESVEMNLQGGGFNWNIIQNVEPFALFDNSGVNVFGRTLPPGTYTLAVTGYSLDNKGGVVTYPKVETTFTIVGTSSMINMPTYTGSEFCAGATVSVNFTTTGTFNVGNQFNVQISDRNGDFTNAITIGTTATAGTVNCIIPLNTPYGENYRIRVTSTSALNQNMNPSTVVIHPYIANLVSPADDYSVDKTRKAIYQLIATSKVNSPGKVNYQAGSSIQLNAGFEAKAGTVFKAEIKGCDN